MTQEEKAKAYDEALERARKYKKYDYMMINVALDNIFPELAESEDERIRKKLIFDFQVLGKTEWGDLKVKDILAWLEKQGEQLYIRFGEIPTDEKSKIYRGEEEVGAENGVSVYPAFETNEGDIVLGLNLPITKTTLYTQQHLLEYDDRPCYLVKGNHVGKDTDGQPLIDNVHIIRKIDSYRVKEEKVGNKTCIEPAGCIEPIGNVEPKFKVGDYIRNKKTSDKVIIEQLDIAAKAYCYVSYDGAAVNHSDFPFAKQDEWELIEQKVAKNSAKVSESSIEEKDMTEYKKGFECGKQRVLKYPEDFGLCKKPADTAKRIVNVSPDWSEEDERNLQGVIDEIEANKNQAPDYDLATYDRFLSWLKSLKERYTWRPSDEQMEALNNVFNDINAGWDDNVIESLYNDLKKL